MQAREKQMARLAREEALASLTVQLGNGKRVRLGDLQGTSRVVIVAGTQQQVCLGVLMRGQPRAHSLRLTPRAYASDIIEHWASHQCTMDDNCLSLLLTTCCPQVSEAVAAAEPFREQLQRRGVFVVPLPVYGEDTGVLADAYRVMPATLWQWLLLAAFLAPASCCCPRYVHAVQLVEAVAPNRCHKQQVSAASTPPCVMR
jgi:hypothetical protein